MVVLQMFTPSEVSPTKTVKVVGPEVSQNADTVSLGGEKDSTGSVVCLTCRRHYLHTGDSVTIII